MSFEHYRQLTDRLTYRVDQNSYKTTPFRWWSVMIGTAHVFVKLFKTFKRTSPFPFSSAQDCLNFHATVLKSTSANLSYREKYAQCSVYRPLTR